MKIYKRHYLFWISRGLVIGIIAFLSLFAFDVFSLDGTRNEKVAGFLIHLIPSFTLLSLLIIFWKRPFAGSVFFTLVFLASIFYFKNPFWINIVLFGPLLLSGVLFFIEWYVNRKSDYSKLN